MYLGIDFGTGGCKAALLTWGHSTIQEARSEKHEYYLSSAAYKTYYGNTSSEVEQAPEDWWKALIKAVQMVTAKAQINPKDIKGIGLSGHSPSILPIGKHGEPLTRAIIWQDARAVQEAQMLSETAEWKQSPTNFDAKVLWFKYKEPKIYQKAKVFLQPKDYIALKLCGRIQIDSASASSWLTFDRKRRVWTSLSQGIDVEKLPEVVDPWEVIGELTADSAEILGLHPGIPIVSGSIDAFCEALGAGIIEEGQTCEVTGTSTCLLSCMQEDLGMQHFVYQHVIPDKYLKILTMSCTGGALKWFVDTFYRTREKDDLIVKCLEELIPGTRPGAGGLIFLPYLCGERSPIWDPGAKGVFFGISQEHTMADFLQAILEGVAFGLKHNINELQRDGIAVGSIHAVGGASANAHWLQVKADVADRPFYKLAVNEGALMGNIMLASFATGYCQSFKRIVEEILITDEEYYPRKEYREMYQQYFGVFKELYPRLKDLFTVNQNIRKF
ncbi:MAG: FGGY-family carbohydrate kinase [Bacillota bacterium]